MRPPLWAQSAGMIEMAGIECGMVPQATDDAWGAVYDRQLGPGRNSPPSRSAEYERRWRAAHPEKARVSRRGWYQRRSERIRAARAICSAFTDHWQLAPPPLHPVRGPYPRKRPQTLDLKARARSALKVAVRRGRIIKPAECEKCGTFGRPNQIHGHHAYGYEGQNRYRVIWLCTRCHTTIHGQIPATVKRPPIIGRCIAAIRKGKSRCTYGYRDAASCLCGHHLRARDYRTLLLSPHHDLAAPLNSHHTENHRADV